MLSRTITMLVSLGLFAGCGQNSEPGGPGVTSKKPIVGQNDSTFVLSGPALETSLKQGESKTVTIGISRGTNFDQDVQITFDTPPNGVSIQPQSPMLRASDHDVKVTIEANRDAALGHHTVNVWGTPAKSGDKTSLPLKLEIKAAG